MPFYRKNQRQLQKRNRFYAAIRYPFHLLNKTAAVKKIFCGTKGIASFGNLELNKV